MKTALLHYWLTNWRGGENVFRELADLFPAGEIFTHALGPRLRDRASGTQPRWQGHPVHETFIAKLPFGRKLPQAYLPLMPLAARSLKLDGYELIVSSESGPIKGIVKPAQARHICYCHTPMRYLWDMYDDYYRQAGLGGKIAMRVFRDYLREQDLRSADSVDEFIANSRFVAARIKRIYGRESTVVYPMVDYDFFSANPVAEVGEAPPKDYYLVVGQLIAYKRPDLAIAACKRLKRPLKVVGDGHELARLRALASGADNVEFLGRLHGERLRRLYQHARALIFPGIEDFGIVPLEAQAAGTPVIAYGVGGALETVVSAADSSATGLFFSEPTVESLVGAIEEFEARSWSASACRAQAQRFEPARFRAAIKQLVTALL